MYVSEFKLHFYEYQEISHISLLDFFIIVPIVGRELEGNAEVFRFDFRRFANIPIDKNPSISPLFTQNSFKMVGDGSYFNNKGKLNEKLENN
jgi:hypothetical protein